MYHCHDGIAQTRDKPSNGADFTRNTRDAQNARKVSEAARNKGSTRKTRAIDRNGKTAGSRINTGLDAEKAREKCFSSIICKNPTFPRSGSPEKIPAGDPLQIGADQRTDSTY